MSDEQENVDAGSETSGETADTAQADVAAETSASDEGADAGGPAAQTEPAVPDANESRTGFAEHGLRAGDQCICPDGRKGTVHSFDAGFVCIPNHDQSE
jgi:hypothetical protein